MSSTQLLGLTAIIAVTNALLLFALFLRVALGGNGGRAGGNGGRAGGRPQPGHARPPDPMPRMEDGDVDPSERGISPAAYHRVIRIAAWAFIMATAGLVAITGLWRETEGAIALVLGATGIFVLVVHDLLPDEALGAPAYVIEGSVAVTVATLLVLLTGRDESPFFFVFPLVVAGAALVATPRATVLLVLAASAGYLVASLGGRPLPVPTETIARMAISLAALFLLAYVAMVIVRENRATLRIAMRLATRDPLTGLVNRNVLFSAMEREIARSARSGRGFCLLMMDLDELKTINDQFGHFEGDRVLRDVGGIIRSGVRRIDVAARYGGDEFVVLLPETDPTGGFVLAEKIRQGAAELGDSGFGRGATLSVGIVSYPRDGRTADELLVSADQAMYSSKRLGRNRVMGLTADVAGWSRESV